MTLIIILCAIITPSTNNEEEPLKLVQKTLEHRSPWAAMVQDDLHRLTPSPQQTSQQPLLVEAVVAVVRCDRLPAPRTHQSSHCQGVAPQNT